MGQPEEITLSIISADSVADVGFQHVRRNFLETPTTTTLQARTSSAFRLPTPDSAALIWSAESVEWKCLCGHPREALTQRSRASGGYRRSRLQISQRGFLVAIEAVARSRAEIVDLLSSASAELLCRSRHFCETAEQTDGCVHLSTSQVAFHSQLEARDHQEARLRCTSVSGALIDHSSSEARRNIRIMLKLVASSRSQGVLSSLTNLTSAYAIDTAGQEP